LLALENKQHDVFSELMDQNFDIRQSISTLNSYHIKMIETARACGVSAKYAGSGGAIVGVCADEDRYRDLQRCLGEIGCQVVRPLIA